MTSTPIRTSLADNARRWAARSIIRELANTKHPRDVLTFVRLELGLLEDEDALYRDAVWEAREQEQAALNQGRALAYALNQMKRAEAAA